MQAQLRITARGITLGAGWRERILRKAGWLEKFHGRITSCSVVVEIPHKHHRKGRLCDVRVDVQVPRGVVVVRQAADSLGAALERAFEAAKERLEEYHGDRALA